MLSFYQNIPVESLYNIYNGRKPLLCALEFGLFKYFWPVRVYVCVRVCVYIFVCMLRIREETGQHPRLIFGIHLVIFNEF